MFTKHKGFLFVILIILTSTFALLFFGCQNPTEPTGKFTWVEIEVLGTMDEYNLRSITSSSDGTKLAAASKGYIYTSTNSGATWTKQTDAGSRRWTNITSSSDGTKLDAVAWNEKNIFIGEYYRRVFRLLHFFRNLC